MPMIEVSEKVKKLLDWYLESKVSHLKGRDYSSVIEWFYDEAYGSRRMTDEDRKYF